MKTLTILSPLHETMSSCGPVLRGYVEVAGEEFQIEADLEKTWLNILDDNSRQESCLIDEDGDILSEGGEWVTEKWTDEDWKSLNLHVAQAKA